MSVTNSQSTTGGILGNGSTSIAYVVHYVFFDPTDLVVLRADASGEVHLLAYQTDYTVLQNDDGTGYVFTTAAWDSTNVITISRVLPITQPMALENGAREPAAALNGAFDRITYIAQQLDRASRRSLRVTDAMPEITPLEASAILTDSVVVAQYNGGFHLWSMDTLAQALQARAAVPEYLNLLQVAYPVGSLYFTTRSENPNAILGFGTWQRFGSGKTIVSLDPEDADFNTVNATGGEKAHALTADENGPHTHSVSPINVTTGNSGDHYHTESPPAAKLGGTNATNSYLTAGTLMDSTHGLALHGYPSGAAGDHTHSVTVPLHSTQSGGLGTAHNNMPPYIVVNVWIRVGTDTPEAVTLPWNIVHDSVQNKDYQIVVNDGVIGIAEVSQ